jgi:hypothetical protein
VRERHAQFLMVRRKAVNENDGRLAKQIGRFADQHPPGCGDEFG